MPQRSAKEIVNDAIQQDIVEDLLLAKPGFEYLPNMTCTSAKSDVVALLSVLYEQAQLYGVGSIRNRLESALRRVLLSYDGLEPTATCILFEVSRRFRNEPSLGFDIYLIATELKKSMDAYADRLA